MQMPSGRCNTQYDVSWTVKGGSAMLPAMSEGFSPTLTLWGAILLGAGLYLVQRGRFLVPALMKRSGYLRARPRVARALVMLLLTLGIVVGGLGCQILFTALR
ncbi:MAG: hypothetical protein ACRDIB_07885 [Ardenticatenaceae bacterium]